MDQVEEAIIYLRQEISLITNGTVLMTKKFKRSMKAKLYLKRLIFSFTKKTNKILKFKFFKTIKIKIFKIYNELR
jgi:hypothetical protein